MTIPYEDFKKIELRVALVTAAERVEKSEKLLKLTVDCGAETRQIIAGLGRTYEPTALVGRKIVIVANLEPRRLMGLESQGMVLAADGPDETVIVLTPERDVAPGASIH